MSEKKKDEMGASPGTVKEGVIQYGESRTTCSYCGEEIKIDKEVTVCPYCNTPFLEENLDK